MTTPVMNASARAVPIGTAAIGDVTVRIPEIPTPQTPQTPPPRPLARGPRPPACGPASR